MLNHMTYFTLILTSGVIAWLFYITFWPFQVVKLHRFETEKTATQGGQLNYTLDFEKKYDYKAHITYFLVDGFVQQLEYPASSLTMGQYTFDRAIAIPKSTSRGNHKLRINIDYEIVPWRHILYTWDSEPFAVR